MSFACAGFGSWLFLLKIFLKFWYDAEKLGHESESCDFKDALGDLGTSLTNCTNFSFYPVKVNPDVAKNISVSCKMACFCSVRPPNRCFYEEFTFNTVL